MLKQIMTVRLASITLALVAMVATSGCDTMSNWLKGRRTAEPEDIALNAPPVNEYLNELQALAVGDTAAQVEIFADAQAAATLTPDPSTRLRYALVLGTSGHPNTNYAESQHILNQLLAQTEMMTSAEIALANIYLGAANNRLTLESETARIRSTTSRAASSEEAASAKRISTLESENRQLRSALAETEDKLAALSAIERSIREQSENVDPQ
jgi:hypothetical protein